jgi:hypothetical protein
MAYTDADIDELVSRKNIHDVLTRYCRAIDRCDLELLRSVYWADAIDDHGTFSGNAWDFADYVIPALQASFEATMHAITNVHMEVAGDVACTECYVIAYHKFRGDRGAAETIFGDRYVAQFDWSAPHGVPQQFFFGGRYLDRFERRGGEWRIFQRTVVMDWNDTRLSSEILDQGLFAALALRGQRGPLDPAYGNRL